jgi:hypothetical protein
MWLREANSPSVQKLPVIAVILGSGGYTETERNPAPICFFRACEGASAILEQMTLNHRVPGSSPGGPTKLFKHLPPKKSS